MADAPKPEDIINPGEKIEGVKRVTPGLPFGQLKAEPDEDGEKVLATNYGGSLADSPSADQDGMHTSDPDHTRVDHILEEHRADGISFATLVDDQGQQCLPFTKHAPIIGRIGQGVFVEFDIQGKELELITPFSGLCSTQITKGRVGLSDAEIAFAQGVYPDRAVFQRFGPVLNNRGVLAFPLDTSGFGWEVLAPSYRFDIQVTLNPEEEILSAWDWIKHVDLRILAFPFTGVQDIIQIIHMDGWLQGANHEDIVAFCDTLNNAGQQVDDRCIRHQHQWAGTGSFRGFHGNPPPSTGRPVGFPVQCADFAYALVHYRTRWVPTGFSIGLDDEGNPIPVEWNDPLVLIPKEVWYPEEE